jgi:putative transposase
VNDVLMVVCDGLSGLADAVGAVWPQTITQTCVLHLLRSTCYATLSATPGGSTSAPSPRRCARSTPPRPRAAAMERFLEFCETWGERYPAIVRLWENAWAELVPFLSFDVDIRKIVCTTNAIESVTTRPAKVNAAGRYAGSRP